jgi:4-hydroxy-2-oxoheptanedioate aldolase
VNAPPLDLTADIVGGWLQLPGSASAELMGSVGFGFLCVDQQHGLIGDDALLPMVQALNATGTPTVVRVPSNELSAIGRALDRGADAVIVPLVDSAEEAERAVAACRYPPRGGRSYGPTRAAWSPGRPAPQCIVMVETLAAVAALPEIAAVEGLDAVFVGPSDLALSSGREPGDRDDPGYERLLRDVVAGCRDHNLPVGIYCASPAHVHRFREMGFTFFALQSEAAILRAAASALLTEARSERSPSGC